MRKNKRMKAVALSTALTMSLLAGCTNKAVTMQSESATEANTTDAEKTTTAAEPTETTVKESTAAVTTTTEGEIETMEATGDASEVDPGTGADVSTEDNGETAGVVETTEEAVETTEEAVETTEAPVETTEAPVETTEAPVETTEAPVETTEAPEETKPAGAHYDVRIVDWWHNYEYVPKTQYEADLWAYREKIQKDHNFTIYMDRIEGWGETYTTELSASITAGDPVAQVCILDSAWVAAMMNNKMMAPLDTLPSLNLSKPKWDQGVIAATSYGGHVYGMPAVEDSRTRYGVFFNKRLLQEVGYSADALYDFQKSGAWNWSKFEEVLKACTRDLDDDGVIDNWGMTSFNTDYYTAAIYSSGAEYVSKDASGKFVNQAKNGLFLQSLTWANDLWHKYSMPQPEDSTWDYFKEGFTSGRAAMRVAQDYVAAELRTMGDEWGFVMFPAPDGQETITLKSEHVAFIPSSYSTEEADRIAFAYDLFTDPVPGYENTDVWKEIYNQDFPDARAVNETFAMMRSGRNKECLDDYVEMFYDTLGSGFIWDISAGAITPHEGVEAKMAEWNACIKEQNNAMKKLK